MYSLVLMTALSGAPDTPEFNGYFRNLANRNTNCNGCTGCTGGSRYSCNGGASDYYATNCTGCTGCTGCSGGKGFLGGMRERWRKSRSMNGNGCCGGSSAYAGCCGGSAAYSGCNGSYAYNPQFDAGFSCYGGVTPYAPAPDFGMGSPFGPPSTVPFAQPDVAPPSVIPDTRMSIPVNNNAILTTSGSTPSDPNRAIVLVRLPVDAKLFADGSPLHLTGPERKFVSPPLPAGQEFMYQFRVEYVRNGETVSVSKRVPVRAGGSVVTEFTDLTATKPAVEEKNPTVPASNPGVTGTTVSNAVPAANTEPAKPAESTGRATIMVKLPANAKLTVDGRECPAYGPLRQFTTPAMPAGREFAYLMKAEVIRDGRTEFSLIQKVHFRAGDQVSVDFTIGGN